MSDRPDPMLPELRALFARDAEGRRVAVETYRARHPELTLREASTALRPPLYKVMGPDGLVLGVSETVPTDVPAGATVLRFVGGEWVEVADPWSVCRAALGGDLAPLETDDLARGLAFAGRAPLLGGDPREAAAAAAAIRAELARREGGR
jgi:hypothetical protein